MERIRSIGDCSCAARYYKPIDKPLELAISKYLAIANSASQVEIGVARISKISGDVVRIENFVFGATKTDTVYGNAVSMFLVYRFTKTSQTTAR